MGLMKELVDLENIYKSMYEGKAESPEEEEEKRREDDDLFGSPNAKKKGKKKSKRWWDDDGDGKGYEKGEVKKEEVVLEKDLSAKERRALPDKDFALPGKGKGPEGKQAGSYPIPDKNHARMALAMVAKHGTPEEKQKVRAAVEKKFPGINVTASTNEELDFFTEVVGFLMLSEVAETIEDAEYIMANELHPQDLEQIKEAINKGRISPAAYGHATALYKDQWKDRKIADYDKKHGRDERAKEMRADAGEDRKRMRAMTGDKWKHGKYDTGEVKGKKNVVGNK